MVSAATDAAWLIDTGFGGHEAALRGQIEQLMPRTLPLSLLPLRLNEFMSIQNIDPFVQHFNVKECFTGNPDAAFWFDFGAGSDSGQDTLDRLNITTAADVEARFGPTSTIDVAEPLRIYRYRDGKLAVIWNDRERRVNAINISR